jgi:hypothetical protein
MKYLNFTGVKAAKRFELCYGSVMLAGDGTGTRSAAVLRKEARILNAFDEVSVEVKDPKPSEQDRVIQPGGGIVSLQDEDWELLRVYVETAKWVPKIAREAVDAMDFVGTAPSHQLKEVIGGDPT